MPLLAYVLYERRGMVTAHFHQESRYPVRKRLIYKALTVPGKQLLLKRDRLRSHISAEYSVNTIILAVRKIMCGKKGQEKKIFQ